MFLYIKLIMIYQHHNLLQLVPVMSRIKAHHWSWFERKFESVDKVIRIVPEENDMLIGFTNSYLRVGDETVDLNNLENDTLTKLNLVKKGQTLINTITRNLGVKQHYSRFEIRNLFYSMLNDKQYGVDLYRSFTPGDYQFYNFPFRSFFDIGEFYYQLNEIAKFLDLNFYPTTELASLHNEFLEKNQGYYSEKRCKELWKEILLENDVKFNLNILEEAWINWQISRSFRCFDLDELWSDNYPDSTKKISQAIFAWKLQDYPTQFCT